MQDAPTLKHQTAEIQKDGSMMKRTPLTAPIPTAEDGYARMPPKFPRYTREKQAKKEAGGKPMPRDELTELSEAPKRDVVQVPTTKDGSVRHTLPPEEMLPAAAGNFGREEHKRAGSNKADVLEVNRRTPPSIPYKACPGCSTDKKHERIERPNEPRGTRGIRPQKHIARKPTGKLTQPVTRPPRGWRRRRPPRRGSPTP